MAYKFVSLVVFVTLAALNHVTARNYSITLANAKLPSPRAFVTALYDDNDSIYLVGAAGTGSYNNQLLKYNVTSDTIQVLATNTSTTYGTAVLDTIDQSIYYSGGFNGSAYESGILKIPLNGLDTIVNVGALPIGCSRSSSIWNHGEYIYNFGGFESTGGYLDTVVRFSKSSNLTQVVSRMPASVAATSAVWDPDQSVAYVFGGFRSGVPYLNDILMFNETSGAVTKIVAVLPAPYSYSCSVLIGSEVFIVGGFGGATNQFAFIKFDTVTHEVSLLFVDNFPFGAEAIGCSWVESLRRIYIFGGIYNNTYQDSIMYIDMIE